MFFRFFLAFSLLFAAAVSAESSRYESLRVAEIKILPQNLPSELSFEETAVISRMRTRVGDTFSQAEFDQDLKNLICDYDQVEPAVQVIRGEIYITLRIWIKPSIRQVCFSGNERIRTSKLKKVLELSAGDTFERGDFIEAFNRIKALYIKKGYFEAELCYEVCPTDIPGQVDLVIEIEEGRAGRIEAIEFCGVTPKEESDLCSIIWTKRHNFFLSWMTGRGAYHHDMVERDRMVILDYFQNHGYADAFVSIEACENPETGNMVVCVSVERGEIYHFGAITMDGNCLFSSADLWGDYQFYRGACFSPDAIRDTILNIQDRYGACGYIDCVVDVEMILDSGCPIYDIHVTIDEGECYQVGLVKVFGNRCTQPRVILHESLLCPGERFDTRKLKGTESRLFNTGYFKSVNVYPVSPAESHFGDSAYRDVYIEVEETETGSVGLFFGFSSLERLFGGVEISERNFNAAGLLSLFSRGPTSLKGGGEYAHLKLDFGDRHTTYLFQWTKPYFLDTPWIVGFDVERSDNRAISRGYEIKNFGGHVNATYAWNDFVKCTLGYRAKHTRVSLESGSSPLLTQEAGISGLISAFNATAFYDSTDSPRKPTSGFRSRFQAEVAGAGGNFQFLKLAYLNSYYYPFTSRGTLKLRADLQFINTFSSTKPTTLPLGERLYLGGETTIRGYRPFIVGPKFGPNEPRGGVSSYLLSEELQFRLFPGVDGFVFCDGGMVSLKEFNFGKPVASVGYGLRVELMRNMPFTVGLGYPIHPSARQKQNFFFSMGGNF